MNRESLIEQMSDMIFDCTNLVEGDAEDLAWGLLEVVEANI